MNDQESVDIRRVVIIPAYNEQEALPLLLSELLPLLAPDDLVIVVDDSPTKVAQLTQTVARRIAEEQKRTIVFITSGHKTGRGGAVRRGLEIAVRQYPKAGSFVECDADGSHRAQDIIKVLNEPESADVVVGSRYLHESHIVGWTLDRRLQSRALNWLIPRLMRVPLTDITNGLRRYSRNAVTILLGRRAVSESFIYLSEQAMVLQLRGLRFVELPIVFAERRAGSSSVTWRELRASIRGLFKIIKLQRSIRGEAHS